MEKVNPLEERLYSYNTAMKVAKYEKKKVTRKSWGMGRYVLYDEKNKEFYFIHYDRYTDGSITFKKHRFDPFHSDLVTRDWMDYKE